MSYPVARVAMRDGELGLDGECRGHEKPRQPVGSFPPEPRPATSPDDVPLPPHSPLCRNDWCDGRCVQEMMSRLEREHAERARRGRAYTKLVGK
jgi:hypothetical protein